MRRAPVAAAVAVSLLVPIVAVAASRGDRDRAPAAAPSFQRDVAPILREKCTGCHQVGGIAPFSLETAKQASKWAQAIGAAVDAKVMPPWPPGPASPDVRRRGHEKADCAAAIDARTLGEGGREGVGRCRQAARP